ncbi:glycoside hydrolase family 3 N-terminal domain-containing protein [Mangrovivirga cuniculi]|uniref:beta-N-acetylhexosaminidase n=1 Tax=Mangrovivirga cuniculi TaxID=2715131 RepID=A0A4D7JHD5_9BACT|nr:glycoside hydrolase family 3 N-terminal domain-containing protein [Mangrovivirga cuniculi]QCK15021.1 serine hydrolase [Mangrovivirga cuniculi]
MNLTSRTKSILILFFVFTFFNLLSQEIKNDESGFQNKLDQLTLKQKVGQLFIVPAYPNRGQAHVDSINYLIDSLNIGGLIYFQGTSSELSELQEKLSQSKFPLVHSMDAEWGAAMRIRDTYRLPYAMTLGATRDTSLAYEYGVLAGKKLKSMGINVSYAPVVDINNNPDNPVISFRSFGEEKKLVNDLAFAYARGLMDQKVLPVFKHFPGHGDTDSDSHKDLITLNHNYDRLKRVELYPYNNLTELPAAGIMIGHLAVPEVTGDDVPASISPEIITGLLKDSLGVDNMVFSDAMDMKGALKYAKTGDLEWRALVAGTDFLLMSKDVIKAIDFIVDKIEESPYYEKLLDEHVLRILKYKSNLPDIQGNYYSMAEKQLEYEYKVFERKVLQNATTILGDSSLVPLKDLGTYKTAFVQFRYNPDSKTLLNTINKYDTVDFYPVIKGEKITENILNQLKSYDRIIIHHEGLWMSTAANYDLGEAELKSTEELLQLPGQKVLLVTGNAYAVNVLDSNGNADVTILTYQGREEGERSAVQALYGGFSSKGQLPVSLNNYNFGDGINTKKIRLGYKYPEQLNINSDIIHSKVDSIVQYAINSSAFPGCQILVAIDGDIFFHKGYGYHTYDSINEVSISDIYDIASITKITSALPLLMKMVDDGRIQLDSKFSNYNDYYKNSVIGDASIRSILAHNARLKSWIPYYKEAQRRNGKWRWRTFKSKPSRRFPIKITDDLYMHRTFRKRYVYKGIKKAPANPDSGYVYSGLSFYLWPDIIKKQTGERIDVKLFDEFTSRLSATTLTYNPLERGFELRRIIPTEQDNYFRNEQIHGTVHDEGAIIMQGLSANAGLFSNSMDLAKMMQMYLNYGSYGGERYISEETLKEFTRCQYCDEGNRRGLGFDKPLLEDKWKGTPSPDASDSSFGHTGYTGTFAWADPQNGLLFIFLSNRVYPTRDNKNLYRLNIRPSIHQVFYDALKKISSEN